MVTRIGRIIGLGLGVWLMWFSPCLGQEEKAQRVKPWSGKWADGRVMTRANLDQILREHRLWLERDEKQGKRAFLWEADLSGAKLGGANLSGANLVGSQPERGLFK